MAVNSTIMMACTPVTHGSYYNHQKKSSVGVEYEVMIMKAISASGVVNILELANRKCKVGWVFAKTKKE